MNRWPSNNGSSNGSLIEMRDISKVYDTGKLQVIPEPTVQEVPVEAQGFDHLDRPAYLRHNAALKQENLAEDLLVEDPDYLDIPAFLRRQAD